jgi:lysophospholipase L1-like esterase
VSRDASFATNGKHTLARIGENLFQMRISSDVSYQTMHTCLKAMSTSIQGKHRPHRIFCYGDSLTAGTNNGGWELHPYAPHLEAGLKEQGRQVTVRHRGLPGWTAANMVANLDDSTTGLRSALRNVRDDPPISVVVLLAGTNDLGYGESEEQITNHIWKLHEASWETGVPRTIAIGIPPSGYQSMVEEARNKALQINSRLEKACANNHPRATFMPFPFEFERGGENWDPDSLHLSPMGYQVLGKSLVPVIERILDELESDSR